MSKIDCKVVLLGSANAGKTCLLQRYIHGRFSAQTQATVAGSYAARKHTAGNMEVILACWDTAGSERYATMSRLYYRKARAAVICFDLTDRQTYERARFWVSELLAAEESCKIYLCGTKKDLVEENPSVRCVKQQEARELADDLQAEFYETSSKTGDNVEVLFSKIAEDYASKSEPDPVSGKNGTLGPEHMNLNASWRKDPRVVRREKSSCCA